MRGRRGFTLLELVVVLALLALGATLVLPRTGVVGGVVVQSEARRLADAIAFGRERAILGGAPLRLVLDVDAGRWQLGRPGEEPGTLAPAREEAAPLGPPTRLPPGVRLRSVTVGGALAVTPVILELRPDGDALPVRIELADGHGHAATIAVRPARARPLVLAEGS